MATALLQLVRETQSNLAKDLAAEVTHVSQRFPLFFDQRLLKGLEKLLANSARNFVSSRPLFHLKHILCTQYIQQRRMEEALAAGIVKPFFLHLFKSTPSHFSIAICSVLSRGLNQKQVLKAFQGILPSVQEIPGSFYTWHHPELEYQFFYFEVQKLRGHDPSSHELRLLEKRLTTHLLSISSLTPTVFWPYNNEDSFRQIQLLQREMCHSQELPHVSIHFQEQTPSSLAFLIHIVKPSGTPSLDQLLQKIPNAFPLVYRSNKIPLPIEWGTFSIHIPSFSFEMRESINLLYARRYIIKQLETVLGTLRDTNGGLFEIQRQHFDAIRAHLNEIIPSFELFAERVFYSLQPVETWLTLSLADATAFFLAFANLLEDPAPYSTRVKKGAFCIFKSPERRKFIKTNEKLSHAQIILSDSHYLCLIGPCSDQIPIFSENISSLNALRLVFQEGAPPSLNPQYSCGDLRARILNKLLFEGLTRFNERGEVELAGAESFSQSVDGTSYTFKLRHCFWSNGEKVTASDYVLSWQRALSESISHPEYLFILKGASTFKKQGLLHVRATDSHTLHIELEKPDPSFLQKLTQSFFFPTFSSLREPKWFNGPFVVRNLDEGGLALDKNPYYWNIHQIACDHISVRWIKQGDIILSLFEKGEIDWIGDPITMLCQRGMQKLQEERRLHAQLVKRRFLIYFNTQHPILSSAKVRRALGLVPDRGWLTKTHFPGAIPISVEPVAKEEVRALFEEGLRELGLTQKNLPPITLLYTLLPRREQVALHLQATWEKTLGIPILVEGYEWNHFRTRMEERNFEMCVTVQDTLEEGRLSFYKRFEGDSSWNFSQWHHPSYHNLLNEKEASPATIQELKQILEKEVPFSPLFQHAHLYAHHPELKGFWIDPEGIIDFSRITYAKESRRST